MTSTVHFADMRAGLRENLHVKLERLVEVCGLQHIVGHGELAAIKLHFGERGGHAYIRPTFVRRIVDQVKAAGGVRTLNALLEMRSLGVTRCGASATESICAETLRRLED